MTASLCTLRSGAVVPTLGAKTKARRGWGTQFFGTTLHGQRPSEYQVYGKSVLQLNQVCRRAFHAQIPSHLHRRVPILCRLQQRQETELREFHESDQPVSCETRRSLYADQSPVSGRHSRVRTKGSVWDRTANESPETGWSGPCEQYDSGCSRDARCATRLNSTAAGETL